MLEGVVENVTVIDETIAPFLDRKIEDLDMTERENWETILKIGFLNEDVENKLKSYKESFDVVVANPSYLGDLQMGKLMRGFTKGNYRRSSSDLYAVFIERCFSGKAVCKKIIRAFSIEEFTDPEQGLHQRP